MSKLKIFLEVEDLLNALAEHICEVAAEAIEARGEFTFVLSGGSAPPKLHALLASAAFRHKIDWSKTYFFFGDERFVPEGDPQRNSLMAEKTLFKPLKIRKSQIFTIDASLSPVASANSYWQQITQHFKGKPVAFDLNLLGLGTNAHTASLFPHTKVLTETEATVKSIFVEEVGMERITMTAPLINQSRQIVFLVFGEEKKEAVYNVLENEAGTPADYPARLISTDAQKVQWYVDEAAASLLIQR